MLCVRRIPGLTARFRSYSSRTTHFGFRTVPEDEKERLVGHVFESVASQYDLMNDAMSGGVHRAWKDIFVGMLGVHGMGKTDLRLLDVAGGTGDIAFRISDQFEKLQGARVSGGSGDEQEGSPPDESRIVVFDINKAMLEEGRKRAAARATRSPRMEWVVGDAMQLPFDDCSFDIYTIAFGIRNVTRIEDALREAHRVLRPGGRFMCLEFSQVTNPLLRAVYERYSFEVIPRMGGMIANDRASYQYLVESIQRFPDQETFAQMLRDANLSFVDYTNLTNGVVAIHSGVKL
eukprot:CAMPEP_0183355616 /NCGR_PEP_ID=MMETSP0164_2-20130417/41114_1 /TAXON_ID=221442 /ORGANISM="Coccolithus pelagicus ssp braarudi, Strain PLY182g" /LENGTH=289 /DNA_ID=CAMNT_0025528773 /DNA_START=22 /DNA_END=891 /DNA_ORIENTATION=+